MKIKLLFLLCIISTQCSAQNWYPLGEGTGIGFGVRELFEFNNKLFIGGEFNFVDGRPTSGVAYWNDMNWIPIRASDSIVGLSIRSFSTYQGELYGFTAYLPPLAPISIVEVTARLVKYNEEENNWIIVPNAKAKRIREDGTGGSGFITDAIAYENELYVIGSFDEIGGQAIKNIAKWNGSVWSPLLGSDSSTVQFSRLTKMIVYNEELIICGTTESNNGESYNNIASWNNTKWSNLNGGLLYNANGAPQFDDIEIFQGALYVAGAGSKVSENGKGYLLNKWNGSFWEGVAGFEQEEPAFLTNRVTALKTFGDILVLAGNGSGQIILYNGNTIGKIDEELNSISFENSIVKSFEILNNQLYAAGNFFKGVARLGSLVNKDSSEVKTVCTLFPNPTSGTFMLSYNLKENSGIKISIYDITGKILLKEAYNDVKGSYLRSLDISGLPKGSYMVNVLSKEFNETEILILK